MTMTREQALQRVAEWKVIEKTSVWNDLVDGMIRLEMVHSLVLHKSTDPQKIFKAQGACDILGALLRAKDNQLKEANDVIEGKRVTGQPARVQ